MQRKKLRSERKENRMFLNEGGVEALHGQRWWGRCIGRERDRRDRLNSGILQTAEPQWRRGHSVVWLGAFRRKRNAARKLAPQVGAA